MAEYGLSDSCTAVSDLAKCGLARYAPPQAGPGRTVKQEQEEISRNHVQTFISPSVHTVWLEGQLTLSEECAVHAAKEGFPAQTKIGKSSGFSRGVSL